MLNKEVAYSIFSGDSILFYGAGFSCGNVNSVGQIIPLTKQLNEKLQKESGLEYEEWVDIQSSSEYFLEKNGSNALIKILRENFFVDEVETWQINLAKYPWKRVYTTNYDNVFEVASAKAKKIRKPINIDISLPGIDADNESIVHLNGFIDNITEDSLSKATKLTNKSYTDTNFINGPWGTDFIEELKYAKSIFFVGFSMTYDLDLQRLVASDSKLREKIYFVNGKSKNAAQEISLKKYGNILEMTAEEFSNHLDKLYKDFIPITDENIRTFSFIKSELKEDRRKITDDETTNLLINGNYIPNKIFSTVYDSSYVVFRDKLSEIIDSIDNFDLLTVTGSLGNGKSIFLKELESILIHNGYDVFVYNKNPNSIFDDIKELNKKITRQCFVIIDDYYSLSVQFKHLRKLDKSKFKLIISGRSAIHRNVFMNFLLGANIPDDRVLVISVDEVNQTEQEKFKQIIDNHNLWGDKAGKANGFKTNFIKKSSSRGLGQLTVEIIRSLNILDKLKREYDSLTSKQKEIVISAFISNILRLQVDVSDLLRLTDCTTLNESEKNSPNFKEFLDIENGKIQMKSSIASIELFKKECDKKLVIETMALMLRRADLLDLGKKFTYLKRELISFSNLRLILQGVDENQLNVLAVEYYEMIKNYKFNKENPFFWLQYGIQKLDEKKFDQADIYFENSKSYARKTGLKDFYQLNAQMARSLVEKAINKKYSPLNALENMKDAHKLLVKDLTNKLNDKSYQLSQGRLYKKIYSNYFHQFDAASKLEFNLLVKSFGEEVEKLESLLKKEGIEPKKTLEDSKNCITYISKHQKNPSRVR